MNIWPLYTLIFLYEQDSKEKEELEAELVLSETKARRRSLGNIR